MRIAFDTTPLVRPYPLGVVRACRGLKEALQELDDVDLVELAPQPNQDERIWRHVLLPEQVAASDVIGVHSPISAFPSRGPGRRVSTVHELPWRNGCAENAGVKHKFWARLGVARGDAVVCPTEFVRGQLIEECGNGLHIHACPWGYDHGGHTHGVPGVATQKRIEPLEAPYFLVVGGMRPKKQLSLSIRALAQLNPSSRRDPLHLVVTGEESPSLIADITLASELGVRDVVHVVGQVSDEELARLTEGAQFTSILSQSEGFGFPVLESYALGTPVLVTPRSAQAELAGAHGIQPSDDTIESIAEAMERACAFPASDKPLLRDHAVRFTWKRCAEQVRDIWGAWA
jgi:glycosyltransferase involved in cell wall biosynthesis